MIAAGEVVVVYLVEPRERFWGLLHRLDGVGVTVEGCDVASFDTWMAEASRDPRARQQLSVLFFPTGRVEKVLLDRGSESLPSFSERLAVLTGMPVARFLGGS